MARNQIKRRVLYVDQDSEARSMPDGACRYILNSRTVNTDGESDGAAENVISNRLIANSALPAGTNTTIGTYSDKPSNTVFYFNHNTLGNHSIFRYYPDTDTIETILIEPLLNFSVDFKITGINLIDDLLYWTDNYNPPRKINIDKANNTGKQFINDVFFNVGTTYPIAYQVQFVAPNGGAINETITVDPLFGRGDKTLEDVVAEFIRIYNLNANLTQYTSASACGIYATLTATPAGFSPSITITAIITTGNVSLKVIANNYYPAPFKEEFINRIKDPFNCEPEVSVQQDPTRVANLIENKVFQFRAQIYYDDYEKSAWGPVSIIPGIPMSCGQATAQNPDNYIEVDFDNDIFNDPASLSIIRGVNIAVRELNTGAWKLVAELSKAQFIANGNLYKFYNDVVAEVLDAADAAKWFDSVGLKVKSQEVVNDRIFDGGITEGYDNVCVDAKLDLAYEENVKQDTFSISGDIFIRNIFSNQTEYMAHQPIHNSGSAIGFGGFGQTLGFVSGYASDYKQTLPLGGFVMYLAGTPYYAVSEQIIGNNPGIQTNGVYDSSSASNRNKIRDEITGNGSSNDPGFPPTRVWSNFTISGVPPGKYILRIAGNQTTQAELDEPNLNWQKSSMPVLAIGGEYSTDCVLEVTSTGTIIISGTSYAPGTSIPPTAVADLTNPNDIVESWAISGYVVDNDGAADPIDDTRIELAVVQTNGNNLGDVNSIWAQYGLLNGGRAKTDHNGFFFWAANTSVGDLDVDGIDSGALPLNPTATDINGGGWNPPTSLGMRIGVFRNTNASVRANSRTIINGNISYSGRGIQGVSVITTRGRVDSTDSSGDFNMFAYVDTLNNPVRSDYILFGLQDTCVATFSKTSDFFNIAISAAGTPQTIFTSPYGGTYNEANELTIADVSITATTSGTSASTFKRGGKYNMGVVYFDNANRNNFVGTSESLRLQIPFYTQIVDGVLAGGGKPIVSWQLKNLPPEWATHYQWVRTINGNQGRYLQWSAKTITYIDDQGNPVGSYTSATQIKISIESISTYKDINPDSQVAYSYEEGDRIVFIKDPNGNFFSNYFDLKIKGTKGGVDLVIYVENLVSMGQILEGTLFEIYNPNKNIEEQFYYEFGECFEIGESAGIKYHKGLTQDQDPLNPAGVPAEGVFRNGDVWVRNRRIPHGSAFSSIVKTWSIEDQSISDFYPSLASSIGRPHIVSKEGAQVYRPNAIRFSNRYIQGTKINGLSSFEALNDKVLPYDYGLINKLMRSKDVLLAMCDNSETVSMYIGKAILNDLSGQNLVAISEKVISDTYEYQGSLGVQYAESVDIDEMGNVYGFDSNKGIVWKRTNNGLEPISSIDNRTYFRGKAKDIANGLISHVPAIHDIAHDQYIISFPIAELMTSEDADLDGEVSADDFSATQPTTAAFLGKSTFAFNNTLRRWESFYSFVPEFYGKARNNILVSFLNGNVYRHEDSSTYNNFYGTQYSQQITFILNDSTSVMKRWLSMSIESLKSWSAPTITTPSGQASSLETTDFELLENVYRADLLRDQNTPNVEYPLVFGDDLLGETINITISNSHPDYSRVFAVNGNFIVSETTNT